MIYIFQDFLENDIGIEVNLSSVYFYQGDSNSMYLCVRSLRLV